MIIRYTNIFLILLPMDTFIIIQIISMR